MDKDFKENYEDHVDIEETPSQVDVSKEKTYPDEFLEDTEELDEVLEGKDVIEETIEEDVNGFSDSTGVQKKTDENDDIIEDIESKDLSHLSEDERRDLGEETGWSKDIVDKIDTTEQADIYKNAELSEDEINDRKCLVKKIDLDYTDPKTGKTNRELMALGRPPFDGLTGERIELHHMGQEYDSPFAELCENSEHGDGNDMILHDKKIESWRQDDKLKNRYNNVDRPKHWIERLKKIESEA
jgi:hypothetical protein